jgi:signal transduction histidine kinase
LFGSSTAVLQASSSLEGHGLRQPDPIFFGGTGDNATERALERLCQQYSRRGVSSRADDDLISVDTLATGEQAVILELALPTRQITLATIAVAVPAQKAANLDSDILDSFVERITLAVENASLYRTLADRSQDLQRAYSDLATAHQELLSVDEMKTNFLANVSHELRTPLTSIRSFSELLLEYEDDPEVQKEFLRIISTESERLTRLVNDVLDISRIEAGHMNWQMTSVGVRELLGDLGRTFGPLISLAHLTFETNIEDDLSGVYGDRDRLNQVIANLLNNAMKFTRPGGTIILRGRAVDDEVHISVSDTGIGVAHEDQERIFEKFQQVGDTLTDKPRGTGLGLPICKDIVEHHQGRMWVESTPGVGSTFTVALPNESSALATAA